MAEGSNGGRNRLEPEIQKKHDFAATDTLWAEIKERAAEEGISASAWLRGLARRELYGDAPLKDGNNGQDEPSR